MFMPREKDETDDLKDSFSMRIPNIYSIHYPNNMKVLLEISMAMQARKKFLNGQ
jgi:hypothetical protein